MDSGELRGGPVPDTVRWAAIAFGCYGLLVIVYATVLQAMDNWEFIAEYPRSIVRALGAGLIVLGLLRRARWAWWVGVGLGIFWGTTGVIGLVLLAAYGTPETRTGVPQGFHLTVGLGVALMGVAVTMLLHPTTRAVFRRSG